MVSHGPILLASEEYLMQIYGTPTLVPLVNDLAKQGLADKQAKQRAKIVDKIYVEWDEKAQSKGKIPYVQPRTGSTFFTPQMGSSINPKYPSLQSLLSQMKRTSVIKSNLNSHPTNIPMDISTYGETTIVPMLDPLPYTNSSSMQPTIVPKSAPLPYPFIQENQKSVTAQETMKMAAPGIYSIFNVSHANEPIKEFTEEEYLGFFQ